MLNSFLSQVAIRWCQDVLCWHIVSYDGNKMPSLKDPISESIVPQLSSVAWEMRPGQASQVHTSDLHDCFLHIATLILFSPCIQGKKKVESWESSRELRQDTLEARTGFLVEPRLQKALKIFQTYDWVAIWGHIPCWRRPQTLSKMWTEQYPGKPRNKASKLPPWAGWRAWMCRKNITSPYKSLNVINCVDTG